MDRITRIANGAIRVIRGQSGDSAVRSWPRRIEANHHQMTPPKMTENKKTVETYMDGFRQSDHALILSCLTGDVEWEIPGAFHIKGKDAFDKEIENEAFVGKPTITV